MDPAQAAEFLREHHRAVLATTRSDGGLQLSPVLAVVDEHGRVCISSRETAYKVRNLYRRPQATLCAVTDPFFGPWVQLEGPVEILSLPEAMQPLVDYYRLASGEHPDWTAYRGAMVHERRCLIRMTVERAGPDRSG